MVEVRFKIRRKNNTKVGKFCHVDKFSMQDLDLVLRLFGVFSVTECIYNIEDYGNKNNHWLSIMSEIDMFVLCEECGRKREVDSLL